VYGYRLAVPALLARFGETLEHAFDLGELAPEIALTVRDGLELRWARVSLSLHDDVLRPAGAAGIALDEDQTDEVVVAMTHAGERLGIIECGPKREGKLDASDL